MTPVGFPHSDIPGSKPVCGSPRLIAAYHVLHRLLVPRHPPCALSSLTGISKVHSLRFPSVSYSVVKDRIATDRAVTSAIASRRSIAHKIYRLVEYEFDEPSLDSGGDSGARTRNLRLAKPALSQLSYIPGSRVVSRPARAWWAWVDSNHPPHA